MYHVFQDLAKTFAACSVSVISVVNCLVNSLVDPLVDSLPLMVALLLLPFLQPSTRNTNIP